MPSPRRKVPRPRVYGVSGTDPVWRIYATQPDGTELTGSFTVDEGRYVCTSGDASLLPCLEHHVGCHGLDPRGAVSSRNCCNCRVALPAIPLVDYERVDCNVVGGCRAQLRTHVEGPTSVLLLIVSLSACKPAAPIVVATVDMLTNDQIHEVYDEMEAREEEARLTRQEACRLLLARSEGRPAAYRRVIAAYNKLAATRGKVTT